MYLRLIKLVIVADKIGSLDYSIHWRLTTLEGLANKVLLALLNKNIQKIGSERVKRVKHGCVDL
jgi:hypothetical protein